jgi:hypothetical protein
MMDVTSKRAFCSANRSALEPLLGLLRDKLNIVLLRKMYRNDSFSIICRMFRAT